jgi:hypothetical protein
MGLPAMVVVCWQVPLHPNPWNVVCGNVDAVRLAMGLKMGMRYIFVLRVPVLYVLYLRY